MISDSESREISARLREQRVWDRDSMNEDTDILTLALDFISEREGTCPFEMFNFQPLDGCEVECGKHQLSFCWYEYFNSKAVK